MPDDAIVLTRADRDEVMKAVAAIYQQLKHVGAKPESIYTIGMNLTVIQSIVGGVPKTSWN
jgi:hypothetical protein